MKKGFILLLFCVGMLTAYTQDSLSSANYQIFRYPNGTKSSEGYLRNGKPDGYWKSYNEQGVLVSEGNRKNFLLDSLWRFYNDKGSPTLEVTYKAGKLDGKRIQYFDNEYIVDFWRADSLLSPVEAFFPNGKIKRHTPIEEGKPHGIEKQYDTAGTIIAVAHFYRGVLTKREQINRTDNFGFKQGAWKSFWENGNLRSEGYYINDKKHGFFKYYDVTGQFLSVEKWENDKLIEDAPETKVLEKRTAYHPNGQPSITATFYKGVPEGIRREYDTAGNVIKGYVYQNGFLRYEGITDLNGLRQGVWKEYYETGELRSKGSYKNSITVGKWEFYFPNKTIEISGRYNNKGRKEGEWIWYYPNGEILLSENWLNGELDGPYIEYDEEGEILAQGEYLEGAEEGEWFYRNNQTIEKGKYFDGMRIGTWKIWFPNGNLAFEIEYDQDLYNGKYIAYWENGMRRITGKYEAGVPVGVWEKYDETGTVHLTTIYKNGKEVQWNNYNLENRKDRK